MDLTGKCALAAACPGEAARGVRCLGLLGYYLSVSCREVKGGVGFFSPVSAPRLQPVLGRQLGRQLGRCAAWAGLLPQPLLQEREGWRGARREVASDCAILHKRPTAPCQSLASTPPAV